MIKAFPQKERGFTLIEMIVSLGVFSIVITIAVGALLVIISTNKQLQAEQSVMSNLAFAMDSMTREMRTGYSYYCDSQPNDNSGSKKIFKEIGTGSTDHDNLGDTTTKHCPWGRSNINHNLQGVSFMESGDSITQTSANRILYYYVKNLSGLPNEGKIMRRVGNNVAQSIIPSNLVITEAQFYVTGSDPQSVVSTDVEQPTVTIYIEAQEISNPGKTYQLQTTVTQRILDI